MLLMGGASLLSGAWLIYRGTRARGMPRQSSASIPVPAGCLPVLTGPVAINQAGAEGLLASIRSKVGVSQSNYDRDYLPALHKLAEFVQLLPASEAHHHAQPGGLVTHVLEVVDIALTLRRGVVLPIGAHPEDLMHHEHRWTYGVFVAALLHDIGRPVADLNITAYSPGSPIGRSWSPLAGTMCEIGATHYRVDFTDPGQRDYEAHTRLGVAMLNRIVPQTTLSWLSEDKALMSELTAYLFGESKGGAIRDLTTKADGESVRRNLMAGPRTRFAVSRATPLIERMMEALRRMLADGGVLPLNRSGGSGWVFEGDIWFVSKRLADEVRRYLQAHESPAGIPGEDKNDRLFDVWQEYGALIINPETGGAIWHARIEGDGYSHTFTMLRFPLHMLYRHPDSYPSAMAGGIVVIEKGAEKGSTRAPVGVSSSAGNIPAPGPLTGVATGPAASTGPAALGAAGPVDAVLPQESDALAGLRDLVGGATAVALPQQQIVEVLPQPARSGFSPETKADDGFLNEDDEVMDGEVSGSGTPVAPVIPGRSTGEGSRPGESSQPKNIGRTAPARKVRVPEPQVLAPVAPHSPAPPPIHHGDGNSKAAVIPENAKSLMAWIQNGIANGDLVYNVSGALIHFVAENGSTLMLLVSPRIFRHYLESIGEGAAAAETDDKIGAALQKEFFKAGWHRMGPKKANILRYVVKRRSNDKGSLLSVVVIPDPDRFVNPLPPPNPFITPFVDVDNTSNALSR